MTDKENGNKCESYTLEQIRAINYARKMLHSDLHKDRSDIELVIKIPKKLYEEYKGRPPIIGSPGIDMVSQAIVNGTPLSKGHGRLIDADAVLVEPFGNTYKDIDTAETIIEADTVESKY